MCLLSRRLLFDSMDCRPPGCLSMGFSRQEYWRRLPFLSPRDRPDPGIEPTSPVFPASGGKIFTTVSPGKSREGKKDSNSTSCWSIN